MLKVQLFLNFLPPPKKKEGQQIVFPTSESVRGLDSAPMSLITENIICNYVYTIHTYADMAQNVNKFKYMEKILFSVTVYPLFPL
jgi:hypothetical protein